MKDGKNCEPPLKHFLPPKQNKISKMRKKVIGFAKSLLNYFKFSRKTRNNKIDKDDHQHHQQNQHSFDSIDKQSMKSLKKQEDWQKKICKKNASKIIKYKDIESDGQDESIENDVDWMKNSSGKKQKPCQLEEHQEKIQMLKENNKQEKLKKQDKGKNYLRKKVWKLNGNKPIIKQHHHKVRDEVIIHGIPKESKFNNEQNQMEINGAEDAKKSQQKIKSEDQQSSFQYSQSLSGGSSSIIFQIQEDGQKQKIIKNNKKNIYDKKDGNISSNKYKVYNINEEESWEEEEGDQQNLKGIKPRKRTKLQENKQMQCLNEITKKKMQIYRYMQDNFLPKIVKNNEQKQSPQRPKSQIQYVDKLIQVQQKKLQIPSNTKRLNRIMNCQTLLAEQSIKQIPKLQKNNFNIENILSIIRQTTNKPTANPITQNQQISNETKLSNINTNYQINSNSLFSKPLVSNSNGNLGKSTVLFQNNLKNITTSEQKKDKQDQSQSASLFSFPKLIPKEQQISVSKILKEKGDKEGKESQSNLNEKVETKKNTENREKEQQKKSINSNEPIVEISQTINQSQQQPVQPIQNQPFQQQSLTKPAQSVPPLVIEKTVEENPFLKKSSGKKDLLPLLINNFSSGNSIFNRPSQSKPLVDNSALFEKKQGNGQFSTPTKMIFQKIQDKKIPQPIPINSPQQNDESSMQNQSVVEASLFQPKSYQLNYPYNNYNQQPAITTTPTMNMFSNTPSSFLNVMPQVDAAKSWNIFGTPPADQVPSLFGNVNSHDNAKKGRTTGRNRKEQRIS